MRMFGRAWKINFSENIFSWPCVLMATQKLVLVKIFTSNHFRTYAQREREREREPRSRLRLCRRTQSPDHVTNLEPRSRLWLRRSMNRSMNPRTDLRPRAFNPRAFDFASDPEPSCHEPIFDPKPSTHRSTNPRTNLQPRAFDPRAFDFTGDPEPSRHEPTNRSLSLFVILIFCVILIDPRTDLRFCVILIFYFLSLISDFFCCCCGGVGGGVLVVFLLCGGGFCVGGGGK